MADETPTPEETPEVEAAVQEVTETPAAEAPESPESAADVVVEDEAAAESNDDVSPVSAAPIAPVPSAKAEARRARRAQPEGEAPVVQAVAKYVRTTPRKARLIADLIRNKDVVEARAILAHSTRSAAQDWHKVLESAVANAENNHELIGDELKIKSITAHDGPTLKRFQPRAHGRAYPILKRTSHLTVQLTPKEND